MSPSRTADKVTQRSHQTSYRRAAGFAAAGAGAIALVHAAPVISSIRPLRVALSPALAGVGRPDQVAITFDDGPDPVSTPRFLDLLAARDVRATFFLLGFMIRRAPTSLVRDIVACGHEIGVHGTDHRNLLLRGPAATRDDLARTRDLIGEITGSAPRWYRPPYGVLTTSAALAAQALQLRPVLWTTWGWDWTRRATTESVQRSVCRHLGGGGTVLLHDADCTSAPGSWRATLGAVPGILDECDRRGWQTSVLSDHLDYGLGHNHRLSPQPQRNRQ
jgi:peptidoglycan-N-acetylglucosamine deacetylase